MADLKANGMVESDDLPDNKSEKKMKSPIGIEKKGEKLSKNAEINVRIFGA